MASKVAFLFPGQGSQTVGMGKALWETSAKAREIFERADAALGEKLSSLCFEGPEEALKLTANTQPAILVTSVAAHAVFAERFGQAPAFFAGHSLGEWSALVAAGAISLEDAVRAVRLRGTFMQEAVPEGKGAMAAVLGLPADEVRVACEGAAQGEVVSPANYNSPEQTVIAGTAEAVGRAVEACKAAGAKRAVFLPVSAPFHCALMEPVKPRLAGVLAEIEVKAPQAPIVTNVEAKPNADPTRVAELLVEQVVAPVRWVECVQAMANEGVDHMVELGPGKVLSGLVRRIAKDVTVSNVEDPASLEKTLEVLTGS